MAESRPGVEVVQKVTQVNPGFAVDGAQKFIAIAASAYGAQQLGAQQLGADWLASEIRSRSGQRKRLYLSSWPGGQENVNPVGDDRAMRRSPMLAGALAAATAIALAVPANADTAGTDQQFLDALTKAGISYHNPGDAIKEAKQVCAMLKDKKSVVDVVNGLTKVNQGTSTSTAYDFTVISAGAYCPKNLEAPKSK